MLHPKKEQARIIGQIQSCYNNVSSLIRPTINQIEFEKAITEDKTPFFFDHVVKSFAAEKIKNAEAETDDIRKGEIIITSAKELSSLERIDVVFDNVVKGIYVDVIDPISNTYKDNAINRKFDRVGTVVKK